MTPDDDRMGIATEPFPMCELHGTRIVFEFPTGCVFAAPVGSHALNALVARGWATEGTAGIFDRRVATICGNCMNRLSADRHMQWLRRRTTT